MVKRNALLSKAEGEVIELGGKCYQTVSEHDIQNNPNQERLNGNVTVILFFFYHYLFNFNEYKLPRRVNNRMPQYISCIS